MSRLSKARVHHRQVQTHNTPFAVGADHGETKLHGAARAQGVFQPREHQMGAAGRQPDFPTCG